MSSIFPIKRPVDREPRGARLVDIEEPVADEVFEALSSSTTRRIFESLHDSPQTTSDLAEATGTSIQNVQYHLEKLADVDLIEVADTWYSERGTEMKVYAPADDALVLFAGRDTRGSLRSLVKRLSAAVAVLLTASVLAGWAASTLLAPDRSTSGGDGGADIAVQTTSTPEATGALAGLDPGLLVGLAVFVGGTVGCALAAGWWLRHRR